ncbi:unnamed protein product [Knipowitschia caucasica]
MEDYAVNSLIVAVRNHPELWKVDYPDYCDRLKKNMAWIKISESIHLSVDFCKKRWRSLRDTFLKERRRKTLPCAAGTVSKWKYAGALSFLDRSSSSSLNNNNDDMSSEFNEEVAEAAARLQGDIEAGSPQPGTLGAEDDLPGPAAASSARLTVPAASPTGPSRKRTRKAHYPGVTDYQRDFLTSLHSSPAQMSEDEHFLYSLLPFLQNLSRRSKDTLKFKMFKLAFEAQEYSLDSDSE